MGKENKKNYANSSKRKNTYKINKEEKNADKKITKANYKNKRNKKEEKIIDVLPEENLDEVITEESIDEDLEKEELTNEVDEDLDDDEDKVLDEDDEEDDEDEDLDDEDKVLDEDDEEDDEDEDLDDEDLDEDDDEEDLDEDDEDEDLDDEDEEENLDDEEDDEDEDLDDEEEVDVPKITEVKKNDSNKKIEKIEQMAKKKKKAKRNETLIKIVDFFDKYRYPVYTFIAGVLITVFVVILIWPDRIATLKDGTQPVVKVNKKTYTANDLYENMKNYYSVSLLLDQIDTDILTKLYPEDDAMKKKIEENAEYYFNMYKQYYNYTQEEFLEKNGFSSYNAFLDYLRLDYRRNQYLDEYLKKSLTDEEIQKYYDENVFGDINTQHVLVEVSSSDDDKKLKDEDAKKLAEEIIDKINDGTSWDTIKSDYKDKVTFEDLGYQSWDASLEESFMTALKGMEDNSYSKEPVKTSYGYHVIYRLDQKKKPSLEKSKDKVITKISSDKKSKDSNLLYKALISLRNEKNIKFSDTTMKEKYDTYCKQYK